MLEYYFKYFGPFIAPGASLAIPGFGQLLNSQKKKAWIHFLLWLVALFINLFFFPSYGSCWMFINVYSALDAHLNDTFLGGDTAPDDPSSVTQGYEEWEKKNAENPTDETKPEETRFKREVQGKPKFKPLDPID